MQNVINEIRQELKKNADPDTKAGAQKFFKERINIYGVRTAAVTRIGKQYFQMIKDAPKEEVFVQCEELWKSGLMEEAFIACQWSYQIRPCYEERDMMVFERWLKDYVNNWATCDTLCNHNIGTLVERFPVHLARLKIWTQSENRWMRRGAAVSLIIPARRGKFLTDILEISGSLLEDKDDLVQKGYGWMLNAASQTHPEEIFSYVMKKKGYMPRTALRYAIEKMPADLKKKAMER